MSERVLSPEEIAEIKIRLNDATPGPWWAQPLGNAEDGWFVCTEDDSPETWQAIADASMDRPQANSTFIAHAPADITALLDHISYLEGVAKAAHDVENWHWANPFLSDELARRVDALRDALHPLDESPQTPERAS